MSGRLNLSLNLKTVIKKVNKVKAHALNTHLFKQWCNENDDAFERWLFRTEGRWLSKENCLSRFHSFLHNVVAFQQSCDPGLAKEVVL